MYSYGSPHMTAQKQDDQHERTFSSYVRIQVVVLKTYLGRWTIGRSGERGSGISVLPAQYDDDDDDDLSIYLLSQPLNYSPLFASYKDSYKQSLAMFLSLSVCLSLSLSLYIYIYIYSNSFKKQVSSLCSLIYLS